MNGVAPRPPAGLLLQVLAIELLRAGYASSFTSGRDLSLADPTIPPSRRDGLARPNA